MRGDRQKPGGLPSVPHEYRARKAANRWADLLRKLAGKRSTAGKGIFWQGGGCEWPPLAEPEGSKTHTSSRHRMGVSHIKE